MISGWSGATFCQMGAGVGCDQLAPLRGPAARTAGLFRYMQPSKRSKSASPRVARSTGSFSCSLATGWSANRAWASASAVQNEPRNEPRNEPP